MVYYRIWYFILFLKMIFLSGLYENIKANEVKIISKINNEIVTNIDVENEYNYLTSLNKSLKEIKKDKVMIFAKNSIIKEKVKKTEISKFYELNKKNETVDFMIENIFKNLNFENLDQFKEYLKNNNLEFNDIYQKIEVEAVWNQLIYTKYKDKIVINEDDLKKKILNTPKKTETLLLSEIVISIKNKNEMKIKFNEVINDINNSNFKEAVLKYSVADSRNNSGLIGWVNKNNLSKNIQKSINPAKIGEIIGPILIPSGMLILKLEDKKSTESIIDKDEELKKLIDIELNKQLNNFSTIHYNKVKKYISINEY